MTGLVYGKPPRIPYSKQTAPGLVGAVIERCTEQRPERRFVSIAAVRSALLNILSTPSKLAPSTSAQDWVDAIINNSITTQDRFEGLNRYIKTEAGYDDLFAIFRVFDENSINHLYNIDESYWKLMVSNYCEWVSGTSFEFAFCDVLVQRLMVIFNIGDTETKTEAVLAAAELGKSHNRWYVMKHVIQMCGPNLDGSISERICIDIKAFAVQRNFRQCAKMISLSYSAYHPLIRTAIEDES